jgi:hypothetical protein
VGLDLKTKVKITDHQRGIQALCAGLQEGEGQDARRVLRPHGLNRKYAGRILSKVGSAKKTKPPPGRPAPYRGQGRKPIYTNDVRKALVKVWAILDCPRGKRLSAALPDTIKPFVEGS